VGSGRQGKQAGAAVETVLKQTEEGDAGDTSNQGKVADLPKSPKGRTPHRGGEKYLNFPLIWAGTGSPSSGISF